MTHKDRKQTFVTGFSLTPKHMRVINRWSRQSGLNKSECVRRAIEELAEMNLTWHGLRTVFK